jgi:serralysin
LNTGTITTLTNTGTISNGGMGADAILSEGPQASIGLLYNSGQIDGAVELLGRSGDTLDNLGRISGDIGLAGGDILMNQGQVYGGVTLGASDTLTDTGLIQGGVSLGASDTFDMSSGEVAGAITASSGDLLEFSGNIGHETIDNFIATGPAHDTLELGPSGFGGYAALSSSMAQVGSDVVIRFGATNSVTLADVSLLSLTTADFKFA